MRMKTGIPFLPVCSSSACSARATGSEALATCSCRTVQEQCTKTSRHEWTWCAVWPGGPMHHSLRTLRCLCSFVHQAVSLFRVRMFYSDISLLCSGLGRGQPPNPRSSRYSLPTFCGMGSDFTDQLASSAASPSLSLSLSLAVPDCSRPWDQKKMTYQL